MTVKVSGLTGVAVPTGKRTVIYNNGTDVGNQVDYLSSLTLGTALPVASGGTGATDAATALTNLSAASSGANTFTAKQTFSGSTTTLAELLTNAAEVVTVSATAATGTIAYYATTQSVLYYTTNASANWVVNLTGASTPVTLNTLLSTGQCITLVFMVTTGATAYYNTSVQVDGTTSGVTTKWASGLAPSSGNANSIEVYTYTVIKTASATFTVLATRSQFA